MQKWSFEYHKYEPYSVPKEWSVRMFSDDMEEEVNCADCGKVIRYGESYVSTVIHTYMGFGYAVCGECYGKEWERRKIYE